MNKNICLIIVTVFVALLLAGCSQQTNKNSDEIDSLKKQIEELKIENEQLKNKNDAYDFDNKPHEGINDINLEEVKEIKLNENVIISDICEFSIIGSNFVDKIAPSKIEAGDVYSYYEVEDSGNIFLDISIIYKNLTGTDVSPDDTCVGKIVYDNKYEYTSFIAVEDNDGKDISSGFTPIAPLTTKIIRIASEIPVEVRDSGKSIVAYITLNDNDYMLNIR